MGRRRAVRAVAAAFLLSILLFGGARLARSAVQGIAAPLAGLEMFARRPAAPESADPQLPSSEDLGMISPAAEEPAADPSKPAKAAKAAAKSDTARALAWSAHQHRAYKEAFQTLDGKAISIELGRLIIHQSELSIEGLPQLAKDLNLSDLQRERIERWLAWRKEALDALGEKKDPKKVREIEESTATAVRAELDFFQGQELDRRRQEGTHTATVRWAAADALKQVHQKPQSGHVEAWLYEKVKK